MSDASSRYDLGRRMRCIGVTSEISRHWIWLTYRMVLFRQLEYFVAVAQERHFARAAEKCYVSQPALSAAIAKLERELNVTLINRGHSFEGLTPEGERLVVWAKRILAEHDAFKAEVDAVRSGITGTLRLGTVPTASTTASLVLSAFCSAHPLVKVQIRSRLAATELYRRWPTSNSTR